MLFTVILKFPSTIILLYAISWYFSTAFSVKSETSVFCIISKLVLASFGFNIQVWRLMLFATSSNLLCSKLKNIICSPLLAIWSATCVINVVLPRLLIAPITYNPGITPFISLSRFLKPVDLPLKLFILLISFKKELSIYSSVVSLANGFIAFVNSSLSPVAIYHSFMSLYSSGICILW